MSGPFKLKYSNSAFPFKTGEKEIKDDIKYDEDYDVFYDKDIQKSYEQRRGRFAPRTKKEKENKNTDKVV